MEETKRITNPLFASRHLTPAGLERAKAIGLAFTECLDRVSMHLKESRELSLVRTKMEEACFYARKALAHGHADVVEAPRPGVHETETEVSQGGTKDDLLEAAGGIIANAGGGDWTKETNVYFQGMPRPQPEAPRSGAREMGECVPPKL